MKIIQTNSWFFKKYFYNNTCDLKTLYIIIFFEFLLFLFLKTNNWFVRTTK